MQVYTVRNQGRVVYGVVLSNLRPYDLIQPGSADEGGVGRGRVAWGGVG